MKFDFQEPVDSPEFYGKTFQAKSQKIGEIEWRKSLPTLVKDGLIPDAAHIEML
jgi:hypothetical protein